MEYHAKGKGLDNTRNKTSQLLHFTGMEVQDIFEQRKRQAAAL